METLLQWMIWRKTHRFRKHPYITNMFFSTSTQDFSTNLRMSCKASWICDNKGAACVFTCGFRCFSEESDEHWENQWMSWRLRLSFLHKNELIVATQLSSQGLALNQCAGQEFIVWTLQSERLQEFSEGSGWVLVRFKVVKGLAGAMPKILTSSTRMF